jgi:LysR family glycine cleavage system transcriptional activator
MPRRPRLNYLRAFDAAARKLSFSLAAEELNLTQAAISQQIRQLEEAMGAVLFIRFNRSLKLSESGMAYSLVVREILDRLDTVTDQIFPDTDKNTISVRCTPSIAKWLAPRLSTFRQTHPETNVRIRTIDLTPDKFQQQRSELEILRLPVDVEPSENMHKLWDAEIFPVCAPDFLANLRPFEQPEDLLMQDLIHIVGYGNDWHRWARVFAPLGLTVPMGLTVDGLNIALDAACRGEGVVLGRRPLIDIDLDEGRLVRAFDGEASLFTSYYLKVNPHSSNWRITRILTDWLTQRGPADHPENFT